MARRILNPRHLVSQALRFEDQLEQMRNSKRPPSDEVLKELSNKANKCWRLLSKYKTHVDLGLIDRRLQRVKVFKPYK